MIKFETPKQDTVSISFDDAKTSPEKIIRELNKGGVTVQGKPVYIN